MGNGDNRMTERASMNNVACKWKAETTMTAADWNEKRKKDMRHEERSA